MENSQTVKSFMEMKLISMGLSDSQCESIMTIAMKEINEGNVRWYSSTDDYSKIVVNLLFINVKYIAKDWIEENKPEAWFRAMFD